VRHHRSRGVELPEPLGVLGIVELRVQLGEVFTGLADRIDEPWLGEPVEQEFLIRSEVAQEPPRKGAYISLRCGGHSQPSIGKRTVSSCLAGLPFTLLNSIPKYYAVIFRL
jgi:hypothetical protein